MSTEPNPEAALREAINAALTVFSEIIRVTPDLVWLEKDLDPHPPSVMRAEIDNVMAHCRKALTSPPPAVDAGCTCHVSDEDQVNCPVHRKVILPSGGSPPAASEQPKLQTPRTDALMAHNKTFGGWTLFQIRKALGTLENELTAAQAELASRDARIAELERIIKLAPSALERAVVAEHEWEIYSERAKAAEERAQKAEAEVAELRPKLTRECEANDAKEAELADLRARLAAAMVSFDELTRALTERDQSLASLARLRAALDGILSCDGSRGLFSLMKLTAWQEEAEKILAAATPAEPAGEVPDNCPKCGVHTKTGRLHMSGCDWKAPISPATTAGGEVFPNPMEIRFGTGEILISHLHRGEDWGLVFSKAAEPHVVGEVANLPTEDRPLRAGEIFIRLTAESAKVLIEEIQAVSGLQPTQPEGDAKDGGAL